MSIRIIWAIMRKELPHVFQDKQTALLVIFTPALLLVMSAYLFSFDVDQFSLYDDFAQCDVEGRRRGGSLGRYPRPARIGGGHFCGRVFGPSTPARLLEIVQGEDAWIGLNEGS